MNSTMEVLVSLGRSCYFPRIGWCPSIGSPPMRARVMLSMYYYREPWGIYFARYRTGLRFATRTRLVHGR
jgi:hypothetical protein